VIQRLLRALAAATALLMAACPTRIAPPSDALRDPDAVLALVQARLDQIRSLSAYARVSYYDVDGAKKARMDIVAQRPGKLFFSALTPTSDLIAALASNGERFVSFERGAKVCYTGRACPANVGRLLPLAMEGEEVVKVLLGGTPILPEATRTVAWDSRVGAYRVHLVGAGGANQDIWIAHGTGIVKRSVLHRGGERVFDLAFDDVAPLGGRLLPRVLELKLAHRKVDMKLEYREAELDPADLDPATFDMACPEGTTPETLPCPDEVPQRHDDP
jgi:outer membrane lipoprotein-sorting protein